MKEKYQTGKLKKKKKKKKSGFQGSKNIRKKSMNDKKDWETENTNNWARYHRTNINKRNI